MIGHLGRVEDLPAQYLQERRARNTLPLWPGEELRQPRRSASAVLQVVEGSGTALVDEARHRFETADALAVSAHAEVRLANGSSKASAHPFVVDDAKLQRKLQI